MNEQTDEWDELLVTVYRLYGDLLTTKLSSLIDEGRVEEVNKVLDIILG